MNYSRRGNPCPVCNRQKDNDCRWTNEAIFCHLGSSHRPPTHLKLGDTLQLKGDKWALVSLSAGYDKSAFLFKPHKEIIPLTKNRAEREQQDFDYSVRISCCEYYAKEFLELAQKALDVLEFESAPPDELKIINGNIFFFAYEQAEIIASPAAIPIDPPIKLKSKIATTIFFDFKVPDATITESFKLFFF